MSAAFDFRPYAEGDEAAIGALFEIVFGSPFDAALWRWRFALNPLGPILVELAWHGDVLAGHYAASPVALWDGERERKAALSLTTMTHPGYRGRGLFPSLARRLYQRMEEGGFELVWGFPNHNSHRGFVSELGWEDVGEIGMLAIENPDPTRFSRTDRRVAPLSASDAELDSLWAACRGLRVRPCKSAGYLRWRYVESPRRYEVVELRAGGRLTGIAAWKTFGDTVDLCDVLAIDTRETVSLVHGALARAAELGARRVCTWCALGDPLRLELERLGFTPGAPVTSLGARRLGSAGVGRDLFDLRAWRPSMGDSDVY